MQNPCSPSGRKKREDGRGGVGGGGGGGGVRRGCHGPSLGDLLAPPHAVAALCLDL